MRLKRLLLENYRGIHHLKLAFADGPVAVLVGRNGSGKSAVLEATAALLRAMWRRVIPSFTDAGDLLGDDDITNDRPSASLSIEVVVRGAPIAWSIVRKRHKVALQEQEEENTGRVRLTLAKQFIAAGKLPPLIVYYPVNRTLRDLPPDLGARTKFDPSDTLCRKPDGHSLDFQTFLEWFIYRENYENNRRRHENPEYLDPQLEAVRRAVAAHTGFQDLFIDMQTSARLMLRKIGETLAVHQLSEGEKCMLALVGDLARRLATWDKDARDPLTSSGIVLLDEIELHLHPEWQRAIIPNLIGTFPGCQFIVTTHSPDVLSGLGPEAIHRLDGAEVAPADEGATSVTSVPEPAPED